VNRDNTVSFQNLQLQIERVHWRGTLAGATSSCTSIWTAASASPMGHIGWDVITPRCAIASTQPATANAVEKTRVEKSKKRLFHRAWKSRKYADPLSHSHDGGWMMSKVKN